MKFFRILADATMELGLFSKEVTELDYGSGIGFTDFVIRGAVSLVLIIILIIALYYIMGKKRFRGGFSSEFRLLSAFPLEQRKMLYLVDVCGKVLVVGTSENSIALLAEIDDPEQREAARSRAGGSGDFESVMKSKLNSKDMKISRLRKMIEKSRQISDI